MPKTTQQSYPIIKETDEFIIGKEERWMGVGENGGSFVSVVAGEEGADVQEYIMCKKCKKKSFNRKDVQYEWLHCCQKFAEGGTVDFAIISEIQTLLNPRYLHHRFDWKKDVELTEMQRMTKAIWAILKDAKLADVVLHSTNGRKA